MKNIQAAFQIKDKEAARGLWYAALFGGPDKEAVVARANAEKEAVVAAAAAASAAAATSGSYKITTMVPEEPVAKKQKIDIDIVSPSIDIDIVSPSKLAFLSAADSIVDAVAVDEE